MRVLIYHGKQGSDTYGAEGDALYDASLRLLKELYDASWYDTEAEDEASEILSTGDGRAAYNFLRKRSDAGYEYERIELDTTR